MIAVVGVAAGCFDRTRQVGFGDAGPGVTPLSTAPPIVSRESTLTEPDPNHWSFAQSTQVQEGAELVTVMLDDGLLMRNAVLGHLEKNTIEGEEYRSQLIAWLRGAPILIGDDHVLRFGGWLLESRNGVLRLTTRTRPTPPFGVLTAELRRVDEPIRWAVARFYLSHHSFKPGGRRE